MLPLVLRLRLASRLPTFSSCTCPLPVKIKEESLSHHHTRSFQTTSSRPAPKAGLPKRPKDKAKDKDGGTKSKNKTKPDDEPDIPLPQHLYPPRLPNLFVFWSQTHFKPSPAIKGGGAPVRAREAAEAWKKVNDAQKEHLRQELALLQDSALAARKEWFGSLAPGALKEINRLRKLQSKRRIRDPYVNERKRRPKRPPNAFIIFAQQYCQTHDVSGVKGGPVREAAEEWRRIPRERKEPFYLLQRQYLEEYKRNKEMFRPTTT